MATSNKFRIKLVIFMIPFVLFILLACGGSGATPEKVGEVEEKVSASSQSAEQSEQQVEKEALATEEEAGEAATQSESVPPAELEVYEVGDIVSIGDSTLVVLGWEEVSPNDFAKPDEGKKFIAVEMLIVNQSDSPASISSLLQMSLKDETGQNYDADLMAGTAADSASVDGELSPGERVRGKSAFQVPESIQGLQFVFDESIFGAGKIFVNLGNAPISLEPPTEVAGETQQQAYSVGDIVSIGDSTLVVLGWEEVSPNDFAKPDEGKKFIAVEMLIVNQSDSPASISSLLQMTIKDSTGQSYDPDLMVGTAIDNASVDGELSPGERMRGKIGFQVPTDVQSLQFVFDAEVFGTGKIFTDLGSQPVSVEPPAEIAGEIQQETFNIGDIVEIGDFTITVNGVSSPTGNDFSKPNEGNKFLVVDVTVENKTTEPAAISSMLQMSLKDPSGQSYDVDIFASSASGGSTPDGKLAPGEKIRGQVGYQVPADLADLVFVFDADVFGAGKAFVALP
ncbi:MAG: DUF4352 domain-containing protein [Anaerolineae bacterium]|nr:DUF4352 domain-containing protein [Anaerolineae bacterium]